MNSTHHEEINHFLRQKTGWTLKKEESIKLYHQYVDPVTNQVNYSQLLHDLHEGVILKEKGGYFTNDILLDPERHLSFREMVNWLKTELLRRVNYLKGESLEKKARLLLGEKQAPLLTKPQLRTSLQVRLSVSLTDSELNELFHTFDIHNSGFLSVKSLIDKLLENMDSVSTPQAAPPGSAKSSNRTSRTSSATGSRPGSKIGGRTLKLAAQGQPAVESKESHHAYDQRYLNLLPPDEKQCRYYSLEEIENLIILRIQEKYPTSQPFIRSLLSFFGENHSTTPLPSISLNQMRYLLWKKLKLNITDANIMAFYLKYSKDLQQPIPLQNLCMRLLKEQNFQDDLLPVAERQSPRKSRMVKKIVPTSSNTESELEVFLWELRSHMNKLLQQEGRIAPHYLIHNTSRMTEIQAKNFCKNRLHLHLDSYPDRLIEKVFREYQLQPGLVDVKRMILEAMALKEKQEPVSVHTGVEEGKERSSDKLEEGEISFKIQEKVGSESTQSSTQTATTSTTNSNGSSSNNNKWKPKPVTPEDIEHILTIKCQERCKNHHPHTMLRKLFRESDTETRFISKSRLLDVLIRLDILVTASDYDRFFTKHDPYGTGKIEVRELLRVLFPPITIEEEINPVLPKDEQVIKKEKLLAKVMSEMTGRRHTVSSLTGSNHTRIQSELLEGRDHISDEKPSEAVEKEGEEDMIASPTTQTPVTSIPPPISENQLIFSELAENLTNALKDLSIKQKGATSVPPITAPKESTDRPLSPVLSVKPAEISPRRPATAPTSRGTGPSRKTKQLQQQPPGGDVMKISPRSPSENHKDLRPRPKSASVSVRSTPQYRQIQRELQLPLQDSTTRLQSSSAKSSPRPETAPHPQYPNYVLDAYSHEDSESNTKAKDDSGILLEKHLLADFDKTHTNRHQPQNRKRARSAPPNRTFFEVKRVEEIDGKENVSRGVLKPYTITDGAHVYYELQHAPVTPASSTQPSPRSTGGSSPASKKLVVDMTPIWKAKTEIAKRFVDSANDQYLEIDPVRESLRDYYKYTQQNQITTSGQYGAYLRSFRKASIQRKQLYEKQKKLSVTLTLQPDSATASGRSSRSRSRSGSRSGPRSRTTSMNPHQHHPQCGPNDSQPLSNNLLEQEATN